MSRRHSSRELACSKRAYPDRASALLALAEIVKARRGHAVRVRPSSRGGLLVDRDGVPLGQVKGMKVEARTYECECGYWHLTSQPKRALVAWIDGV